MTTFEEREAALLAAYAAVARPTTLEDISEARRVLLHLSERCDDAALSDMIGEVRHALSDWADEDWEGE